MTNAHSSSLGYFASRQLHQPPATGVAVAKVAAALAIAATSLAFAAFNLGVHPVPAGHAVVTPAHQQTVLGRGSLPALHLSVAVDG